MMPRRLQDADHHQVYLFASLLSSVLVDHFSHSWNEPLVFVDQRRFSLLSPELDSTCERESVSLSLKMTRTVKYLIVTYVTVKALVSVSAWKQSILKQKQLEHFKSAWFTCLFFFFPFFTENDSTISVSLHAVHIYREYQCALQQQTKTFW